MNAFIFIVFSVVMKLRRRGQEFERVHVPRVLRRDGAFLEDLGSASKKSSAFIAFVFSVITELFFRFW